MARSACNKKTAAACKKASNCTWVSRYQTSAGDTVKGYCRKATNKKPSSSGKRKSSTKCYAQRKGPCERRKDCLWVRGKGCKSRFQTIGTQTSPGFQTIATQTSPGFQIDTQTSLEPPPYDEITYPRTFADEATFINACSALATLARSSDHSMTTEPLLEMSQVPAPLTALVRF